MSFSFGVEGLNAVLNRALVEGSILVIAGHPSSGKTVLASTICAYNAQRGHRCVYISFLEDRLRYFSRMKELGLDMEDLEKRGLFKFFEMPLIVDSRFVSDLVGGVISRSIEEFNPKIVVFDPISPLLKVLNSDVRARSLLHNYLINLTRYFNGLTILVAEVSHDEDKVELNEIEFIADTVLMLKNRIVKKSLINELLIMKSKYSRITTARLIYTIEKGKGFKVYPPPVLNEIPAPKINTETVKPCRDLINLKISIHPGEFIHIYNPSLSSLNYVLLTAFISTVFENKRTLVISYESPPNSLWNIMKELVKGLEIGSDIHTVLDMLSDHLTMKGLNPYSYVPEQLYYKTLELVDELKPDTVMFIGATSIGPLNSENFKDLVVNHVLTLRKLGLTVILVSHSDDFLRQLNESIADVIIYIKPLEGPKELDIKFIRKGRKPIDVDSGILNRCVEEMLKTLEEQVKNVSALRNT
ncbi:MAG: ATPase domain-containing protein [Sulfolobales archaeon]|nr:AAA family ATPase [Sulfolobales archaeon]MDW7970199.1 ATPase domain-containing protein [Sulfolobales archaeon]